jgi:integrase
MNELHSLGANRDLDALAGVCFSTDALAYHDVWRHDLNLTAVGQSAWRAWCESMDKTRELPHWLEAEPDDAWRFADNGNIVDGLWIQSERNGILSRHVGSAVCEIRRIYEHARTQGLAVSPAWLPRCAPHDLSKPRPPPTLSSTICQALLPEKHSQHWLDLRDRALIGLATELGLRTSEIARLTIESVSTSNGRVFIDIESCNPGSTRSLVAKGSLAKSLEAWKEFRLENRIRGRGPIWYALFYWNWLHTELFRPFRVEQLLNRHVRRAQLIAGLPPIEFGAASLRHTRVLEYLATDAANEEAAYHFGLKISTVARMRAASLISRDLTSVDSHNSFSYIDGP